MNDRNLKGVFQSMGQAKRGGMRGAIPLNIAPQAPPMPDKIVDTTGYELKKGQIVHIPTSCLPGNGVFEFRVVDIIMPSKIETGQPPRPPMVVLGSQLAFAAPSGKIHPMYVVTDAPELPAEAEPGVLESEKLPEGVVLPETGDQEPVQ